MQIVLKLLRGRCEHVQISSPGDNAGFEPGDQIDAINGRGISSVSQIRNATATLRSAAT